MVIQFSLANYRSFHQVQTLRFRASGLVSEDKTVDERNTVLIEGDRILKSVGVYGANGSGKSNLLRGFGYFCTMVSNSLNMYATEFVRSEFNVFRQSAEALDNYGFFEIILLLEGNKYRYGFTLDREAGVAAEWLFGPAEKNETYYFQRKDGKVNINPIWFQEGDDLPREKLRDNALFLSFCASYDGKISSVIRDFVAGKITLDDFTERHIDFGEFNKTDDLIESGNKAVILDWMRGAGLFYSDIRLNKLEAAGRNFGVIVTMDKNVYNASGEVAGTIQMDMENDESDGTKKFYSYIGNLYQKFQEGGLFISDEIDSNFHPALLRRLIGYFNDPAINRAGAQLLFTSHDTNLMDPCLMRRDQFYFTEKSLSDETVLYALSDLKGIRNNADFAKQYLAGLYGALPVLGNYLNDSI